MVAEAGGRAGPVPLTEPGLGAHFGLDTCFHREDTNRFAKLTRPFGSLALPPQDPSEHQGRDNRCVGFDDILRGLER
jgi:hypothetical protein